LIEVVWVDTCAGMKLLKTSSDALTVVPLAASIFLLFALREALLVEEGEQV
jgi:hypothetical protein